MIASTETRHEEGATELPTEYTHEGAEEHEEKAPDAFTAAREERDAKLAARRAESEALRKESAAPAPKAAVGFKQEVRKSRAIKRSMEEDEHPGTAMLFDKNRQIQEVTPIRSSTAQEAIKEHYDANAYDKEQNQFNQHLIERVNKLSGDTEVHYLSKEDMDKHYTKGTLGLYDPNLDQIFIREGVRQDTALHEAFHAATTKALQDNPELQDLMDRLHNEVLMGMPEPSSEDYAKLRYALSDPEEFLTGLMTNPNVQKLLKGVKISEQLARDIGIPKWRKMTAWNTVLHIIQKALGLSPRDVSAIEAAMSISEQAMWAHRRGVGDLMEAQGRAVNATREAAPKAPVSLYKTKFQREDPPERDQNAFLKTPAEHFAGIKNIDRDMVKGYTKDLAGNVKVGFLSKTAKFLSGTQLSDLHGKIFTDAKGNIIEAINNARNKVVSTYNTLRGGDKDLIHRGYILDRKYASRMGDYAELLNLSSRYNIHADREAPKASTARKNVQRDTNYGRARDLYNSLPTELQKRYTEEKQYYRDKQQALAKTVLDKTLPVLDLPKDMEERVRNNDLTDDDWEQLGKLHAAEAISNAQRLINKKDVYFPGGRGDGRWVVTGRYEMPKGGKDTNFAGDQLADNKREFDTEDEARKYAADTHMPAEILSVIIGPTRLPARWSVRQRERRRHQARWIRSMKSAWNVSIPRCMIRTRMR